MRPGLWLDAEAGYGRDDSAATLNAFSGQALYIGPRLRRVDGNAFVSPAWHLKIWGKAISASSALDLATFGR
jgi:hypothetical protein